MTVTKAIRCSIDECSRPAAVRGLCKTHYQRKHRAGEFATTTCNVDGCNGPTFSWGMCNSHYRKAKRAGRVGAQCSHEGCTRGVEAHGKCDRHQPPRKPNGKPCKVDGCDDDATRRGLCGAHYQAARNLGEFGHPRCSTDGCDDPAICRGLCHRHYQQGRRKGFDRPGVVAEFERDYECSVCGVPLPPERPFGGRCERCGPMLVREAGIRGTHRRRQRIATGPTEMFDRIEIYERDGWICQLCGDPVDPTLEYPDRMSKSLDHVVPIAKGGPHTRANSQLAHLSCNSSKQDRLDVL